MDVVYYKSEELGKIQTPEEILSSAKVVVDFKDDLMLRQDNQISQNGQSDITYLEHRVILSLLALVEREGDFDCWYKIYLPALANISNSSVRVINSVLAELGCALDVKRLCLLSEDEKIFSIPWITGMILDTKNKFICVQLNRELAQWTLGLKKNYTEEFLSVLFTYKRHASMILHCFFCSVFNKSTSRMDSFEIASFRKEVTLTIDALRYMLSAQKNKVTYANVTNFMSHVVIPALKEINDKGYFNIKDKTKEALYVPNKFGKTIYSITFGVAAGLNNTRLERQKLIDLRNEQQRIKKKELEKEAKKAIPKTLKTELTGLTSDDLLNILLETIPEQQLEIALQKISMKKQLQNPQGESNE